MAAEHGAGLLQDSHFWVLMSFVVFVAVAFVKGRKPLTGLLDGRTARIRSQLEEATRLRAEAQELLTETQRNQRDAVQTSQKIIEEAKATAARVAQEADARMTESLKRREALLLERIARAESRAVQELRTQAADIAARAATQILHEALPQQGGKLVDAAIGELPGRLN